jgi:hypothetical protein
MKVGHGNWLGIMAGFGISINIAVFWFMMWYATISLHVVTVQRTTAYIICMILQPREW